MDHSRGDATRWADAPTDLARPVPPRNPCGVGAPYRSVRLRRRPV